MTTPHIKPSPVHESSLKQALQRVEDRIRRQEEKRLKDEHHSETLKLARKLADEGVRQRQKQWKKEHRDKASAEKMTVENQNPAAQAEDASPSRSYSLAGTEHHLDETPHASAGETAKDPTRQASMAEDTLPGYNLNKLLNAFESAEHPKAETEATLRSGPLSVQRPLGDKGTNKGLMRLMPAVAWLILCAGIIGAALSWTTVSAVWADPLVTGAARDNTIPLGLLLGFAYLATGVLGFAFFWVSSQINSQLKEIRRMLFLQPMMSNQSDGRGR